MYGRYLPRYRDNYVTVYHSLSVNCSLLTSFEPQNQSNTSQLAGLTIEVKIAISIEKQERLNFIFCALFNGRKIKINKRTVSPTKPQTKPTKYSNDTFEEKKYFVIDCTKATSAVAGVNVSSIVKVLRCELGKWV